MNRNFSDQHGETVVLLGPPASGKSTLAPALAQRLDKGHVELDDLRWAYYDEIGFDHAKAKIFSDTEDFGAMFAYWKPFEIHALERVISDHAGKVIELGGGHSVYEDAAQFGRAVQALKPVPFAILLLPSSDLDESCRILRARTLEKAPAEGWKPPESVLKHFEHLARHPSNTLLAKQMVYTLDQTPAQTLEQLVGLIGTEDRE